MQLAGTRADPYDEGEADGDRCRPGEWIGEAVLSDDVEGILQHAQPLGDRVLLAAEAALLLERAGRDDDASAAVAPRVALDRVANEAARERLVACVPEHRVHDD